MISRMLDEGLCDWQRGHPFSDGRPHGIVSSRLRLGKVSALHLKKGSFLPLVVGILDRCVEVIWGN